MISGYEYILVALGALLAGAVNALAGGGTLITFPLLTALGLPALAANVTNTVALSPGYLGGTLAQREDLRTQTGRLRLLLPISVVGGVAGGLLLLLTGERVFREVVPFLILMASGLLAVQDPLRAWLVRRAQQGKGGAQGAGTGAAPATAPSTERYVAGPVFLATVYGGYFGAGVSVIVLAVLGLLIDDSLTRLNALKQAISFVTNMAAAIFFVFSGQVVWPVALVMAVGAILGGILGGRLAGRVRPATLRWIVVTIGVIVGIIYLVR